MWLGIGITITVVLLITILISVCEVWCKIVNLQIAINWLMKEITCVQEAIDLCEEEEEEEEEEEK